MGSIAGLRADQITLIKATVPVLAEHGKTITDVFYKNLLDDNPTLKNIFNIPNQRNGHQSRALSGALYAYAAHIDDLDALSSAVELICNKHASLRVQPQQYTVVGKYLLEAMAEVLGDAFTPEIHDAWAAAYWQLADLMIAREQQLYRASEGWTDWRDFKIIDKVKESEEITSFHLAPVDGKPLPPFGPGQYISVQVFVPELKCTQPRQYSLSDKPSPDYYRISVKKENGLGPSNPVTTAAATPGYVSNLLHDTFNKGDILQVSHPYGDFFLSVKDHVSSRPVVLLSAGVGITPLTSILNSLTSKSAPKERSLGSLLIGLSLKKSSEQPNLHFIHGARTSSARAFKDHVTTLSMDYPNLQATFFTSLPSEKEEEGVDYHFAGRVDLDKLDANKDLFLDNPATKYFICGPEGFMSDMKTDLLAKGVDADRIKMESFGTGGVPH